MSTLLSVASKALVVPVPAGMDLALRKICWQPFTPNYALIFVRDSELEWGDGDSITGAIVLPHVSLVVPNGDNMPPIPIGVAYFDPRPMMFSRGICIAVGSVDNVPPGVFKSVDDLSGILSIEYSETP